MEPETISSLLGEAAVLMLVGMVFVFAFLGLTIAGVHLIARFVSHFPGPQAPIPNVKKKAQRDATASADKPAPHIVAAITAAVHQHRQANE